MLYFGETISYVSVIPFNSHLFNIEQASNDVDFSSFDKGQGELIPSMYIDIMYIGTSQWTKHFYTVQKKFFLFISKV